jgi:hypothetical protein
VSLVSDFQRYILNVKSVEKLKWRGEVADLNYQILISPLTKCSLS